MRYVQYAIDHPDLDQPIPLSRHAAELLTPLCGGRLVTRSESTARGTHGTATVRSPWTPAPAHRPADDAGPGPVA